MSSARARRKRRERIDKERRKEKQILEDQEALEDELDELTPEEEALLLEDSEEPSEEDVEKSVDVYAEQAMVDMSTGPTTFEELDDARAAQKKAGMIRQASYDVEDLVHNIIKTPMLQGDEKADMIKKVGTDFGERVKAIMDTPAMMLKEHADDIDLLEAEVLIAQDERGQSWFEKHMPFSKKTLSSAARNRLSESDFALPSKRKYPIHDKAHVRNALARAAQMLKKGGEAAADARKALPKIRAAAKKFGIGADMKKDHTGIIIQKDAKGDWRWVGWPSNNFIDRSGDIITEAAHQEYVTWWNKEKPSFPVFTSLHAPGSGRTYPVDFVGYENGFLVMSGRLTEGEAARLLKKQKERELGMSHTGFGVRSTKDPRQIVMYRSYEVTDLPIEMADNPFTDLSISKEADMNTEEQVGYLADMFGSKEKGDAAWKAAEQAISAKTAMKQKELQAAGVESKEKSEKSEDEQAMPDMQEIFDYVAKELDVEGLNDAFTKMQEAAEKLPILEGVVRQQQELIQKLGGEQDEALAEMLDPPAGRFAWSKANRPSESDATKVDDDEKERLQKKAAGLPQGWLSEATGTVAIEEEK